MKSMPMIVDVQSMDKSSRNHNTLDEPVQNPSNVPNASAVSCVESRDIAEVTPIGASKSRDVEEVFPIGASKSRDVEEVIPIGGNQPRDKDSSTGSGSKSRDIVGNQSRDIEEVTPIGSNATHREVQATNADNAESDIEIIEVPREQIEDSSSSDDVSIIEDNVVETFVDNINNYTIFPVNVFLL